MADFAISTPVAACETAPLFADTPLTDNFAAVVASLEVLRDAEVVTAGFGRWDPARSDERYRADLAFKTSCAGLRSLREEAPRTASDHMLAEVAGMAEALLTATSQADLTAATAELLGQRTLPPRAASPAATRAFWLVGRARSILLEISHLWHADLRAEAIEGGPVPPAAAMDRPPVL